MRIHMLFLTVLATAALSACSAPAPMARDTANADVASSPELDDEGRVETTRATGVPVQPVERKTTPAKPSSLRIQQGAAFSYAVPERWRVVE